MKALNSTSPLTLKFKANSENAVKNRGGYNIYIGDKPGFSISESVKEINVDGSEENNGYITASITGLSTGSYYVKIRAYSDLTNPFNGSNAISDFSDEVSFEIK